MAAQPAEPGADVMDALGGAVPATPQENAAFAAALRKHSAQPAEPALDKLREQLGAIVEKAGLNAAFFRAQPYEDKHFNAVGWEKIASTCERVAAALAGVEALRAERDMAISGMEAACKVGDAYLAQIEELESASQSDSEAIALLRARCIELVIALQPFDRLPALGTMIDPDWPDYISHTVPCTIGDLRRVRAALSSPQKPAIEP